MKVVITPFIAFVAIMGCRRGRLIISYCSVSNEQLKAIDIFDSNSLSRFIDPILGLENTVRDGIAQIYFEEALGNEWNSTNTVSEV